MFSLKRFRRSSNYSTMTSWSMGCLLLKSLSVFPFNRILRRPPPYNVKAHPPPTSGIQSTARQTLRSSARQIFVFPSDPLCGDARLVIPLEAGRRLHGWQAVVIGRTHTVKEAFGDGIWVVQRLPWMPNQLLQQAKAHGVRLVYDLDDLLWEVPGDNWNRGVFTPGRIASLFDAVRNSNCVTVATEPLADALAKQGIPAIVLPSCLPRERWERLTPRRRTGGRPRVGWAGQRWVHNADLAFIAEIMDTLGGEVEWVFLGDAPACTSGARTHVEVYPMVPLTEYPARLASLNLDLALAPLSINAFNEAKSDLRILHYGILGYPVVATDIFPHRKAPVALVANDPTSWLRAIRERIHDLDAAEEEGRQLRQWVLAHRMIETWLPQYRAAWFGELDGFLQESGASVATRSPLCINHVDPARQAAAPGSLDSSVLMPVFNKMKLTRLLWQYRLHYLLCYCMAICSGRRQLRAFLQGKLGVFYRLRRILQKRHEIAQRARIRRSRGR